MKRYFWLISTIGVFICGYFVHIGYEVSHQAAWSILVSSINGTAWELTKPFALVYIMWTFIELSCLRPSLLHFVCSKIIMLHGFAFLNVTLLGLLQFFPESRMMIYLMIIVSLSISQFLSYCLYHSKCRIELFYIPILISFVLFFTVLLFASVYPPAIFPFQMHIANWNFL